MVLPIYLRHKIKYKCRLFLRIVLQCPECDYQTEGSSARHNLKVHIEVVHQKVRSVSLDQLEVFFFRKFIYYQTEGNGHNLKVHVEVVHQKVRSFFSGDLILSDRRLKRQT